MGVMATCHSVRQWQCVTEVTTTCCVAVVVDTISVIASAMVMEQNI